MLCVDMVGQLFCELRLLALDPEETLAAPLQYPRDGRVKSTGTTQSSVVLVIGLAEVAPELIQLLSAADSTYVARVVVASPLFLPPFLLRYPWVLQRFP